MIFLPLIFLEKASYSKLGSNVFKSLPSSFIQRVSMNCRLCARHIWGYQEENKDFCLSQGTRQVIKVRFSKYSVSEAIACWKPCKKENRAQDTRDGQLGCPRPEEDSILLQMVRDTEGDTGAKSWRGGRQVEHACRKRGNSQSRSPEAGWCSWGSRAGRRGEEDRAREGSWAGENTRGPASSSQWQTDAKRAPTIPDP